MRVISVVSLFLVIICQASGSPGNVSADDRASIPSYLYMQPDWETVVSWKAAYERAPLSNVDEGIASRLSAAERDDIATSMNLFAYHDYIPAERNQTP